MSHQTHVSNKPLPKRMERVLAAGMAIRRRDVLATEVRYENFVYVDVSDGRHGIHIQVIDDFGVAGFPEMVFYLEITWPVVWPVAWPQTYAVQFEFGWSPRANPDESGPALGPVRSIGPLPTITFQAEIANGGVAFSQETVASVVEQFTNQTTNTTKAHVNAAKKMLCGLLLRLNEGEMEYGGDAGDDTHAADEQYHDGLYMQESITNFVHGIHRSTNTTNP